MKNILIIYPHWPPSNLAGVHRPRLIGNYLKELGWNTTALTVHEKYYEEKLDPEICKTVAKDIKVIKTKAFSLKKPRIIGDIGLRGGYFLYKKAIKLIQQNKYDFIWVPIPSFYTSLLGRFIYEKTKIPYGIDYIDPWVRDIHNRKNWRSIISLKLAKFLEPIAVKKASLISGVSFDYYKPVLERNFNDYLSNKTTQNIFINPYTKKPFIDVAMPYGFDPNDHKIKLETIKFPWSEKEIPFIYAGAYLPNSKLFMEEFMKNLRELKKNNLIPNNYQFYFLGTGNYPGKTIKELSIDYDVEMFVTEIRERYSFIEILNFLSNVEGIMIFGSTEEHYTASKTFQAIMANKKIFSIFHKKSSAVECMKLCNTSKYTVEYLPNNTDWQISFEKKLAAFLFDNEKWESSINTLTQTYSSFNSAKKLTQSIENILQ